MLVMLPSWLLTVGNAPLVAPLAPSWAPAMLIAFALLVLLASAAVLAEGAWLSPGQRPVTPQGRHTPRPLDRPRIGTPRMRAWAGATR